MAPNILIIGGGQIGQRYLQGSLQLTDPISVFVVDPSIESQFRCREFVTIYNSNDLHQVSIRNNANDLPSQIDVCIVATQSSQRLEAVKDVIERSTVKYWILEKLLADNPSDLSQIGSMFSNNANVWVNTMRRATPLYKNFKMILGSPNILSLRVEGGSWGIASNAIHFVDLLCYLAGDPDGEIESSCSSGCIWVPSQRAGIVELIGKMEVSIGSSINLEMISDFGNRPLTISAKTGESATKWDIDEDAGQVSGPQGFTGRLLFQSEITPLILKEIFESGSCGLTSIDLSLKQHSSVMKAFADNWQQGKPGSKFPPIT